MFRFLNDNLLVILTNIETQWRLHVLSKSIGYIKSTEHKYKDKAACLRKNEAQRDRLQRPRNKVNF